MVRKKIIDECPICHGKGFLELTQLELEDLRKDLGLEDKVNNAKLLQEKVK